MQNVYRLHKRLCVFFNGRLFIECITVKQNKINHNTDNFVYVCINVTKNDNARRINYTKRAS